MQRRQRDDLPPPFQEERVVADKKRISTSLHESHEWLIEASLPVDIQDQRFHPEGAGRCLHTRLLDGAVRVVRVDEHGYDRDLRYELAQQLQLTLRQRVDIEADTCHVAARSIEILDQTGRDRVAAD